MDLFDSMLACREDDACSSDVLLGAHDWMAVDPSHWNRGSFLRNSQGNKNCPLEDAVAACVWGACRIVSNDKERKALFYLDRVARTISPAGAVNYNEKVAESHAEILALMRRARDLALSEGD